MTRFAESDRSRSPAVWKKLWRWAWFHRRSVAVSLVASILLALNAVAFMHAWAMTHFVDGGPRTGNPESLSAWQKVWVLLTGVRMPRPTNEVGPESLGLKFETHRFGGSDRNELEGWYVAHERARGLVLLFHGYASCKSQILREAAALHQLGYATFLVDFRGSGGSGGRKTSVGLYEADDVAAAFDYARSQWSMEPCVLFGQSMGAAAVLRAVADRRADPHALVLECPFDRLLSTVENRFSAMGLPSFPFAELLVFWGGVQQGFDGFDHNPAECARMVSVPVLLLRGGQDTRVTTEQAGCIFRNLDCPKELATFPGVGHESLVAHDTVLWMETVGRFLERIQVP